MLVVAIYSQQLHHQLWKLLVNIHVIRLKNQRLGNSYVGLWLVHPNMGQYVVTLLIFFRVVTKFWSNCCKLHFTAAKQKSFTVCLCFLCKIKKLNLSIGDSKYLIKMVFFLTSDQQLQFSPRTDLSKSAFCRSWDSIKVIADVQRARHWKQSMMNDIKTRCT